VNGGYHVISLTSRDYFEVAHMPDCARTSLLFLDYFTHTYDWIAEDANCCLDSIVLRENVNPNFYR